jgi:5-methylcytosine-specific restriction endonuclease McrA
VTQINPKKPRIKLPSDVYERVRLEVLNRDGWKCQECGSCQNLHVHHQIFRSQAGDDSELNLITLCNSCHAKVHS